MAEVLKLAGLVNTVVGKISDESIVNYCKEFTAYAEGNLDCALSDIEEFDVNISSQVSELKEANEGLQDSVKAACKFICCVDDFFYYGQITNFESIKNDIKKGNSKKLKEFLHIMSIWLKNVGEAHVDLEEKCKIASQKCTEGAEMCSRLQASAKKKKIKTRLVGGTVSTAVFGGGLAAGGAAASVFAGMFTFGIGTVVGLGVVAAGLTITGVGTATATGVLAYNFKKDENSFRLMSGRFRELAEHGRNIKHQFDVINTAMERYKRNHEFLATDDLHVDGICNCLDLLQSILQSQHKTTSKAKDKMNTLQKKIEKLE